jgi:probable phosphoglycerate mutase
MGEIVLLRHGQTEWSHDGRHTGRTDVPLTTEGEHQARQLAGVLAGRRIKAVWTSPARRAQDTAELAGLSADEVDPDLWEWDYGGYEGITSEEIHKTRPGWYLWSDGVVPGGPGGTPGETVEQVGARCDKVIRRAKRIVHPDAEGDVVLVAHGHVLRVLAARWLGLPPAAGALLMLDTASISRLGFEHARPALTLWNFVPGD